MSIFGIGFILICIYWITHLKLYFEDIAAILVLEAKCSFRVFSFSINFLKMSKFTCMYCPVCPPSWCSKFAISVEFNGSH